MHIGLLFRDPLSPEIIILSIFMQAFVLGKQFFLRIFDFENLVFIKYERKGNEKKIAKKGNEKEK